MTVKIVTDSTSYLPALEAEKHDIRVVPLNVCLAQESYKEVPDNFARIYSMMTSSPHFPTSSQPSPAEFLDVCTGLLEAGHKVLVVTLSSEISGTFASAVTAQKLLKEKYSPTAIEVVDSRTCGMALGFIAIKAASLAENGASLAEVKDFAAGFREKTRVIFVPYSLENLIRGGRLTGVKAVLGTALNIKPVLVLDDGRIKVRHQARGFKTAVSKMLQEIEMNDGEKIKEAAVHYTTDRQKAEELAATFYQRFGIKPHLSPLGPVVGLHVGPGALGIAYTVS